MTLTKSDRNISHEEAVAAGLISMRSEVEELRRGFVYKPPGASMTYDTPDPSYDQSNNKQLMDKIKKVEPIPDLGKLLRSKLDAPLKASDRQVAGDHYKKMGIQTWDVVDTWPREQKIGYYRGGALKYLMRMGSKDENAQEIAKGQHYIEKLLEVLKDVQ